MNPNPTLDDALNHVCGLRGKGWTRYEAKSWADRLAGHYPEDIIKAADKIAGEWQQVSPWPIGVLLARMPAGDQTPRDRVFTWSIDGMWRGDATLIGKMSQEDREGAAAAILAYATDEHPDQREVHLAEMFAPGAWQRYCAGEAARQEARRRRAAQEAGTVATMPAIKLDPEFGTTEAEQDGEPAQADEEDLYADE